MFAKFVHSRIKAVESEFLRLS